MLYFYLLSLFENSRRLRSYLLMLPMDPKKFQAASPQLDGEQCG